MTDLFPFPRTREAPPEILGGLRAVRPDVDLLWWGLYGFSARDQRGNDMTLYRPAWLLVVPGVGPFTRANAAQALERWAKAPVERVQPQKVNLALLRYRGWRAIAAVPARDPDWSVVDDFAAWDWATRFGQTTYYDMVDQTPPDQLEARLAQMVQAVQALMPDVWRYVWKGRRSVLQAGSLN